MIFLFVIIVAVFSTAENSCAANKWYRNSDYGYNGGCIVGCGKCASATTCTTCARGWVLDGTAPNTCSQCMEGCQVCVLATKATVCSQCFKDYKIYGTEACLSCTKAVGGSTGWDANAATCTTTSKTKVSVATCKNKYALRTPSSGDKTCVPCGNGQLSCSSDADGVVSALTCEQKFYKDASTPPQCIACSANTLTCNKDDSISCIQRNALKNPASGSDSCVPCGSNQKTCTSDADGVISATGCDNGFYVDGSTPPVCVACSANTKTCDQDNSLVCLTNFGIKTIAAGADICVACGANQKKCTVTEAGVITATECNPTYYVNTDSPPICASCSANTLTCTKDDSLTCEDRYALKNPASGFDVCLPCGDHQKTCTIDPDGIITAGSCDVYYGLNDAVPKICVSCTTGTGSDLQASVCTVAGSTVTVEECFDDNDEWLFDDDDKHCTQCTWERQCTPLCENTAPCKNSSYTYTCECDGLIYGGTKCGDCKCVNGGTCGTSKTQCECIGKYTGQLCDTCTCKNGGTCTATNCTCAGKYSGVLCETCDCKNGGSCKDGKCACVGKYDGELCNECTCLNGGTCTAYNCTCTGKYSGALCATCDCKNGGSCKNDKCVCSDGFDGDLCENELSGAFKISFLGVFLFMFLVL